MKRDKRQTIIVSAGDVILNRCHNRACSAKFVEGVGDGAEISVAIDADEIFGREAWLVHVGGIERFCSFRRSEAEAWAIQHDDNAKRGYGELATVSKGRLYLASRRRIEQPVVEGGAA